eukprot:jgi/Galph1/2647/GphlegSOOS_G1277.1
MNRVKSVLSLGSFTNDTNEKAKKVTERNSENASGELEPPNDTSEIDLLELHNIRENLESLQVDKERIDKDVFIKAVTDCTGREEKEAEAFFELLDVKRDGYISLQRFVSGYSLFCHVSTYDRLVYLFHMFDEDNDGYLSFSELEELTHFIHDYYRFANVSFTSEIEAGGEEWKRLLSQLSDSKDWEDSQVISFEKFQELAKSSYMLSSFMKHVEESLGLTSETLRTAKEGDLLAVEMERMSSSLNSSAFLTSKHLSTQDGANMSSLRRPVRRTKRSDYSSPFAIDYESLTFLRKIGEGSFAEVWAGQWLHMPVAIKVFRLIDQDEANVSTSESRLKNFLDEVETLSQLRHPNVLLYMGACVYPEKPLCIVSELFNGGSVYDYLHGISRKSFPIPQAVHVALGVARGLHYLHSSEPVILHRDLKSSNVLIDKHVTHVVICDFGLSILADNRSQSTRKKSNQQSVGTPYTMAPEAMLGEPYKSYSDIYSFSVLLWEIFTGQQPFVGLKPIQMMFQVAEGKRPSLVRGEEMLSETTENLDCIPDEELLVPRRIAKLIQRGWDSEPKQRPTLEEVLLELEQFQSELSPHEDKVGREERIGLHDENKAMLPVEDEETRRLQRCMTLMNRVVKNDIMKVEEHLEKYPEDIHFADYDQRTPLHIASSEGHVVMVKLFLERGASTQALDRWHHSPLDDAVSNKHNEVIALFKNTSREEQRAIDSRSNQSISSLVICLELMDAVYKGERERVSLLLEAGAPVNYSDYDRRTPLHIAASEGHDDIVQLLLQYGADIHKIDRWGSTPMDDAKRGGFVKCLETLKEAEKNRNSIRLATNS